MNPIAKSLCTVTLAVLAAASAQAWSQGTPQQTPVAPAQPAAPPQQAASPFGPDNGFFRPSHDVSITHPRPLATQAQYQTLQSSSLAPAAPAAAAPATAEAAPAPAEVMRVTEDQMDRTEREALRDNLRMQAAPAGVGAAWDGSTSERDR